MTRRKAPPSEWVRAVYDALRDNLATLARAHGGADDATNEVAGKSIGLPKSTYHRIQTGEATANLSTLMRVAEKLRMPLWQLFVPGMELAPEQELLATFRDLEPAARAELLGYARGLHQKKPRLALVNPAKERRG